MPENHQELNLEIIDDLLEVLGDSYLEIVEDQITQANEYMSELHEAESAGAVAQIQKIAHTLKSSVGQVGLQGIFRLAKALEYHARDDVGLSGKMSAETEQLAGELAAAYPSAVAALRKHVNTKNAVKAKAGSV